MLAIAATLSARCKVGWIDSSIFSRRRIIRADQDHIDVDCGVIYGAVAGEPLLVDVYRALPHANRRPAVVLIHGGGMWTGSRVHMEQPARRLAQAGYVAFSVDYRLVDAEAGYHRWPA